MRFAELFLKLEEISHSVAAGQVELRKELSKYDKEKSRIFDEIMNSNYNAADGYDAYKRLRTALRNRRIVKGEIEHIRLAQNIGIISKKNVKRVARFAKENIRYTQNFEPEIIAGKNIDYFQKREGLGLSSPTK